MHRKWIQTSTLSLKQIETIKRLTNVNVQYVCHKVEYYYELLTFEWVGKSHNALSVGSEVN